LAAPVEPFSTALHHIEAERRILLDAAAADNHRAERAHGFGIAGVGLLLQRRRDLGFVDLNGGAVAQAIGDVARRIGIAMLGGPHRPGDAGALVARQTIAGQQGEAEQIFGGRLALHGALDDDAHVVTHRAQGGDQAEPAHLLVGLLDIFRRIAAGLGGVRRIRRREQPENERERRDVRPGS
jgi:hypothetical protein